MLKSSLIALATMAAVSTAHAVDTYSGKLTGSGLQWTCSFYNDTGSAITMKYASFSFDGVTGDDQGFQVQEDVKRTVGAGDTIRSATSINTSANGRSCEFVAR